MRDVSATDGILWLAFYQALKSVSIVLVIYVNYRIIVTEQQTDVFGKMTEWTLYNVC